MAWEQWIIPVVLLGGVGTMYYLMAKKGIGGCGSMMSSGCGMGRGEAQESCQPRTEAREPAQEGEGSPPPPAAPARTQRGVLVGRDNGYPEER